MLLNSHLLQPLCYDSSQRHEPMVLGLDFYDTITAWPTPMRRLAKSVLDSEGQVHIVTAIKAVNRERNLRDIKDSRVPYTKIHQVIYKDYSEIPSLKVPLYKELNCDLVIEDNEAVVNLAVLKHLCAVQIFNSTQ